MVSGYELKTMVQAFLSAWKYQTKSFFVFNEEAIRAVYDHGDIDPRGNTGRDFCVLSWIPFYRTFTPEETEQIRSGLKSRSMDEKWDITCDGNRVDFRRSWTQILSYRMYLRETPEGTLVHGAHRTAMRLLDQKFRQFGAEELGFLIDGFLLEKKGLLWPITEEELIRQCQLWPEHVDRSRYRIVEPRKATFFERMMERLDRYKYVPVQRRIDSQWALLRALADRSQAASDDQEGDGAYEGTAELGLGSEAHPGHPEPVDTRTPESTVIPIGQLSPGERRILDLIREVQADAILEERFVRRGQVVSVELRLDPAKRRFPSAEVCLTSLAEQQEEGTSDAVIKEGMVFDEDMTLQGGIT